MSLRLILKHFVSEQIPSVCNLRSTSTRPYSKMEPFSDLSFIEVKDPKNPSTLFLEWIQEARQHGSPANFMCLATATKTGGVNSRTVAIKEILPGPSLVFTSQLYSTKISNIKENPQVASTILLGYTKGNKRISKQINVTGNAEQISPETCKTYFESQSLPAKLRTVICKDGGQVEWNDLKRKHDELLKEVTENREVLEMPDTMVAYKIVPNKLEFYFTDGINKIGDRILFRSVSGRWDCVRLMP